MKVVTITANISSHVSVVELSRILDVTNFFEPTVNFDSIAIDSGARFVKITRFVMKPA